ncbi:MAG: hypothetical protein ABIT83_12260 [Massilia sp.]
MPSPQTPPSPPAADTGAGQSADARSESLLPATPDDEDDGRYAVAEEVSLDQQSDQARRVGQLPPEPAPAQAIADALQSEAVPPVKPQQQSSAPQSTRQEGAHGNAHPRQRTHSQLTSPGPGQGPVAGSNPDREP